MGVFHGHQVFKDEVLDEDAGHFQVVDDEFFVFR